jgi:hypothetical protein
MKGALAVVADSPLLLELDVWTERTRLQSNRISALSSSTLPLYAPSRTGGT